MGGVDPKPKGGKGVIPAGQGGTAIRVLTTVWGYSAMLAAFIVAFTLQVRTWAGMGHESNGFWIGGSIRGLSTDRSSLTPTPLTMYT